MQSGRGMDRHRPTGDTTVHHARDPPGWHAGRACAVRRARPSGPSACRLKAPDDWSGDARPATRTEAATACGWCPVRDACRAYGVHASWTTVLVPHRTPLRSLLQRIHGVSGGCRVMGCRGRPRCRWPLLEEPGSPRLSCQQCGAALVADRAGLHTAWHEACASLSVRPGGSSGLSMVEVPSRDPPP